MNVLSISVHPDDETIGCGGTLLKHLAAGDKVYLCFVTSGNEYQRSLIDKIHQMYGFTELFALDFNEMELADISLNILIPRLAEVINYCQPEILYIPNRSDVHSDHRRVFEAIIPVTKPFRYPFIKKVLMCEVHSETDLAYALTENAFIPNSYSDISLFWDKKLKILSLFKSEIQDAPRTRSLKSIEALSIYRGSIICVDHAEAFMLVFEKN